MNDSSEEWTTTSYYYEYDPCWYEYCDENGTVLDYPFYWCCGANCNGNCTLSARRCEDACWKTYRDLAGKRWSSVPGEGVQIYMLVLGVVAMICWLLLLYTLFHVGYHFGWCGQWCYLRWPLLKFRYCPAFMDFDSETVLSEYSSKQTGQMSPKSPAVVPSKSEPSHFELAPISQSEPHVKDVLKDKRNEMDQSAFDGYLQQLAQPRGRSIPILMKLFSIAILSLFWMSISSHIFQVFGLLRLYDGPLCESYIGPGENLDWVCYKEGSKWNSLRMSLAHGWRLQFSCWFFGKDLLYLLIAYRMYQTFRPSVYKFSEMRVVVPECIKTCSLQCCAWLPPDQLAIPKVGPPFVMVVLFQTGITMYWGGNPKPVTKGNDQEWIAWLALCLDIFLSGTLLTCFMMKLKSLIVSSAQSSVSDKVLAQAHAQSRTVQSMSFEGMMSDEEEENDDDEDEPEGEVPTMAGSPVVSSKKTAASSTTTPRMNRTLTMEIEHQSKNSAKQSQKLINVATKQLVLATVVFSTSAIVMTFRAIVSDTEIDKFDDYSYVWESMFVSVALDCFVNALGVWLIFKFSSDYYNCLCWLCDRAMSKLCFAVVWSEIDREMRRRASVASAKMNARNSSKSAG